MLADYLKDEVWQDVMQGVRMTKPGPDIMQEGLYNFNSSKSHSKTEIFFCCQGIFLLARKNNSPMRIASGEIFLVSDISDIKTVQITEPVTGYCISIDNGRFLPRFKYLCEILGNSELYNGRAAGLFSSNDGCIRIPVTSWTRSVFSVLSSLPYSEQGRYCIMKTIELFYLINAKEALLKGGSELSSHLAFNSRTIKKVRSYMEEHLDEKLTIPYLSRKFNISPTALKNGFRDIYGMPVHTFLQEKRIEKASELLSFSRLTVIQIAEAVGYEGVSQFNLMFKRKYGITPSRYRKMSKLA